MSLVFLLLFKMPIWNELGFIPPAQGGTEFITMNGKRYRSNRWMELQECVTLTDAAGISPGDIVFQEYKRMV